MQKFLGVTVFGVLLSLGSCAQGLFSGGYTVDFIKGPGTYVLRNGTTGSGDLRFKTRNSSILFAGRKLTFLATEVASFTIDGHTLVPQGRFDFRYGVHSYRAERAFIEFADTTGLLQLAVFHTTEPIGSNTTVSFSTYLWRRRGEQTFVVGPNSFKKGSKSYRAALAASLNQWPALQQAVAAGTATFENFPDYVRQANQSAL